jgi:hypothetical protein
VARQYVDKTGKRRRVAPIRRRGRPAGANISMDLQEHRHVAFHPDQTWPGLVSPRLAEAPDRRPPDCYSISGLLSQGRRKKPRHKDGASPALFTLETSPDRTSANHSGEAVPCTGLLGGRGSARPPFPRRGFGPGAARLLCLSHLTEFRLEFFEPVDQPREVIGIALLTAAFVVAGLSLD